MKLWFPKDDRRRKLKPLRPDRPWLFHGAKVKNLVLNPRHSRVSQCNVEWGFWDYKLWQPVNIIVVEFAGSEEDYDLVSREYLR